MEYRKLGNSDLEVSVTGLGGNTSGPPRLDEAKSIECIHRALDLGINFVDTSIGYGQGQSELYLAKALKGRQSEMLIGTKFNLREVGDESVGAMIAKQCDESLRKLETDHIDLYQHAGNADVSIEELLQALQDLVQAGKVRYVGTVNYSSWRQARTIHTARDLDLPELVSSQHNDNIVRRHVELEVLPMCETYNVGFLPNATLAGGYLTDKYTKGQPAPEGTRGAAGSPMVTRTRTAQNEETQDALKGWAHDRGHTLGELALAWLAACPQVSSILTGVSTPQQVEENVKGGEWKLTAKEKEGVDTIADWAGSFERIEGSIREPGAAR